MLRRNSSRSKQRRPLGRSKSTSSIFRGPVGDLVSEPLEAERDAHIAATLSFHRAHAQARHSCDMAAPRAPRSTASGLDPGPSPSATDKHHDGPSANGSLRKQHSVRFAGPNARPRRPLAARANQAILMPGPQAKPGAIQHLAAARGQLSSSDVESQVCASDVAQSLVQIPNGRLALVAGGVPMGPSFGRLRKSRSMFTSSIPPTSEFDFSDDGPTERLKEWLAMSRHSSEDKENQPMGAARAHGLRAPNSTSMLRGDHGGNDQHSRASSRADNHLAVQPVERLSRSRRLKSNPSLFFRPKYRRSENSVGLPRSLRNSSNNSAALSSAFSENTMAVPKQMGLRGTARKVSRSLKSKFRGLFGRPKSADDAMGGALHLPPSSGSDSESCRRTEEAPAPGEASMSRVLSHVPSLHAVPSNQQLRSRQGSLESIHVEQKLVSDDRSRVTSWTNSTANTVAGSGSSADWERQRLSVIKENGMHVPSCATARTRHGVMGTCPPGATALPPGATIDSQRVYSALLKRLNETRQQQGRATGADLPDARGLVPARSSSVEQAGPRDWSPPTIRCVQEDDVFQDPASDPSWQTPRESPTEGATQGAQQSGSARSVSYRAYPLPTAGDGKGLSPERMNPRPEMDPSRSLAHKGSALFASPTGHLFRTASPFRHALRETMKEAKESEHRHALDARYLSTLSALSLPTRRPSTVGSERDLQMTYAESIYSCATDDADTDQPRDHGLAQRSLPRTADGHGDATMSVDTATYKPPPAHSREFSTASSVEWKTWLSANVSKLETPSTTVKTDSRGDVSYTLPPFGHVREEAEIESPGDMAKPEAANTSGLSNVTPAKLAESPCQTSVDAGTTRALGAQRRRSAAVDENHPPATGERAGNPDADGPPEVPSRSGLRAFPSLSSVKTGTGRGAERPGGMLPRMRSLNTIANSSPPAARDEQLLKRRARRLGAGTTSPARSSPGLTAAVEKQFGKASTGSPRGGLDWGAEHDEATPRWETDGASHESGPSSDWDAQVMGSKRMVDLFLSSRRKRIEGSKTGTESENMSVAFL